MLPLYLAGSGDLPLYQLGPDKLAVGDHAIPVQVHPLDPPLQPRVHVEPQRLESPEDVRYGHGTVPLIVKPGEEVASSLGPKVF